MNILPSLSLFFLVLPVRASDEVHRVGLVAGPAGSMSVKTQIWESDDSTDEARAAPAAAAAAADPAKKDRRDDNEEEEEEQGRSVRDAAKQTLSGRNKLLLRLAVASGVFAAICAGKLEISRDMSEHLRMQYQHRVGMQAPTVMKMDSIQNR